MDKKKPKAGTITAKDRDTWFNLINNIPVATSFYYMDRSLMGLRWQMLKPFTHSGQVINFLYTPFLDQTDVDLEKIPYDQDHYGTCKEDATAPTDMETNVFVYKIINGKIRDKEIGAVRRYPVFQRSPAKSWGNESKLYQYPYHYLTITDFINTPLKIIDYFLPTSIGDHIPISVSQPISITGGYTIYIQGYKGDFNHGALEGLYSTAGLDLPTSSSQYSQFMANSKASLIASNDVARRNENMGLARGGVNALAGAFNTGGAIMQATNPFDIEKYVKGGNIDSSIQNITSGVQQTANGVLDMVQSAVDRKNRIQSTQAKLTDLMSAPRNVSLGSTDILMTLDRNNREVIANRYMVHEYYLNKLCDYFTLYGYKQNKLMKNPPGNKLYNSRRYFNYIKTVDANIIILNTMDKAEVEAVKEIFNAGVTWWHWFRCQQDNVEMYDTSMDNKEIY